VKVVTSVLLVSILVSAMPARAQLAEREWGKPCGEYRIHEKAECMEGLPLGPFGILPNGALFTVEDAADANDALISKDDGNNWERTPIFAEPEKFAISYERALYCTKAGTVIVSFMNYPERSGWKWDEAIHDSPGATLPNYVVRSPDGGRTWEAPQLMHKEWTGAVRDMVQLRDGSVVFTSQMLLHDPGRHATVTYASSDEGKTWTRSNVLDLGGIGHHDGAIEASFVQREDDSLFMLLRTNWGRLWEAVSWNGGKHWHPVGPSEVEASTAPPILERLKSGRIFMAWNPYSYVGTDKIRPYGGDWQRSGAATSNNRHEMLIAFSEDEGESWSEPVVIATVKPNAKGVYGGEVSYPYAFERRPGEIWLTAWRGAGLRMRLFEKDFAGN
jgi:hypothetical protein